MSPRGTKAAEVEVAEDDEEALAAAVRDRLIAEARASYAGPGVYDWPSEAYHADPVPGGSARSTTLRTILRAGGPALVEHERLFPRQSGAFDYGGAAHRYVLGKGDEVVEVPFDSWRTNDAKAMRREARAAGKRPLLAAEVVKARRLAEVVRAHPLAGTIFGGACGVTERSTTWIDPETGETCRMMLDLFPHLDVPHIPVAADLKTTTSVELRDVTATVVKYGYHQQVAFALDALAVLGAPEVDFLLVFVTKEPPHLVRTVRVPPELLDIGRRRNRRALDRWSWCRDTGEWPPLPAVIEDLTPPAWALREDTAES